MHAACADGGARAVGVGGGGKGVGGEGGVVDVVDDAGSFGGGGGRDTGVAIVIVVAFGVVIGVVVAFSALELLERSMGMGRGEERKDAEEEAGVVVLVP